MRIPHITLAAAGALALSGCAYGDMGLGLGYGDYGYGSPYYGYGYGYGPYGGYGAYPGYYGGFGYPFGWYGDYYYPGTGIYVYDSYRRPRVWTSTERTYWTSRRPTTTVTTTATPNWSGFTHRTTSTAHNSPRYQQRVAARQERMQAREQRRQDSLDRLTTNSTERTTRRRRY
jgi:hypothetical protein